MMDSFILIKDDRYRRINYSQLFFLDIFIRACIERSHWQGKICYHQVLDDLIKENYPISNIIRLSAIKQIDSQSIHILAQSHLFPLPYQSRSLDLSQAFPSQNWPFPTILPFNYFVSFLKLPLQEQFIIIKMQTNLKLSLFLDSSLQSNTFSMKRVTATNAATVIVNFTPIQSSINLDHHDAHIVKSHPVFNNDHRFFTPSFMLDQDKIKVPRNLEVFKDMHQFRVAQANQQKEEFYLPKPSKTNSYCSVCKIHYEDYLTHLTEDTHIQKTEKSRFKKDIDRLCKAFNIKSAKKGKVTKTKTIIKEKGKALPSNKCQERKEQKESNQPFLCASTIQCQL